MFRMLTILAVLAALGWAGYWAVGRAALIRGIEAAATEARAQGWTLDWRDLSVAGFPNRFDTEARGLSLRDPAGDWGLDAPGLQVLALSYRPNRVIVVPRPPLSLLTPAGPVDIAAETLRASATFALSNPPVPARFIVETEALTVQGLGQVVTLASGQIAMREAEAAPENAYDLATSLTGLSLDAVPDGLPDRIDSVTVDATATLDGPLREEPVLAALTLRKAEIAIGALRIDLRGDVTVGPGGTPEGTLVLGVENWSEALPILAALGVPAGQVAMLNGALAELEVDGRAEIPLTLAGGALRFGAIPLVSLPRLPAPYNP